MPLARMVAVGLLFSQFQADTLPSASYGKITLRSHGLRGKVRREGESATILGGLACPTSPPGVAHTLMF